MSWGIVAGAAVGVVGSAITSSSAKSAANSQSDAANAATMAQMQAQAQQRSDLQPWVQSGQGANSLLNKYLGIGGVGSSGVTSSGLATGLSPDQVRQQLLSRYTTTSQSPSSSAAYSGPNYLNPDEAITKNGANNLLAWYAAGQPTDNSMAPGNFVSQGVNGGDLLRPSQSTAQSGPTSTVDEAALNAAIQQYYQDQNSQNSAAQADPTYGSLLTPFHNGAEFDPGPAFSFTGKDLASDPGYQFGLDQGTQGINNGQAARGNFLSGAAMKELAKYNEDYAGTKFGDAFNRNLSTYNTNLGAQQNAWNTNLGAYNDNRNRVFNFLNGVSTLGQNSAAGTGAAALQVGNNIAGNALASGNAQAAGQVATGNALTSGINTAVNNYNSTSNLNSAAGWNNLLSQQGGGYSGYTGYAGGSNDPIANLNTKNGWTG